MKAAKEIKDVSEMNKIDECVGWMDGWVGWLDGWIEKQISG